MAFSALFMDLDVDRVPSKEIQHLVDCLYGKCPFCLKSALSVANLLYNQKMKSIITWFER